MKISLQWLQEWVDITLDLPTLIARLTMAGLEVESTEKAAGVCSGVVVGQVLTLESHPNADKLRICQVDVGADEPVQIVCGAANVRVGLKIPAALVGATLTDFKIKKAKLRGEVSHGMLCSAKELGLAQSSEGLFELPEDAPVGEEIADYLQLDDHILDIGLTPNRGDCLSYLGMAREISAITDQPMHPFSVKDVAEVSPKKVTVLLQEPSACPRYCGRLIHNVNTSAPTPIWLQERLRRSGIRSISIVVDVLNYVMLALGQPMHAFDAQKITGDIIVRTGVSGEKITLLDEQVIELDEKTLVIADTKNVLALAGVMGGLASGVTTATQDIFLESAHFTPTQIAQTARRYRLHSDSSHRFERGVDVELPLKALHYASALIQELAQGEAGPITHADSTEHLPTHPEIRVSSVHVNQLLGTDLALHDMEKMLHSLGMKVSVEGHDLCVRPPSYRFDMTIAEDVIEEIARLHGYDNIPLHVLPTIVQVNVLSESQLSEEGIKQLLVDRAYHEAICYSFISDKEQQRFDPEIAALALTNPISSDMSVMRTSLWPGLLKAALHNVNRQQNRVRLFEMGRRYLPSTKNKTPHLAQDMMIAGLALGALTKEQWGEQTRSVDFYDVKADVEALLSCNQLSGTFYPEARAGLHPGQSAAIEVGGKNVGFVGALHPGIAQAVGLDQPVFLFELQLAGIEQGDLSVFQPISKFPAIRRDLAIVVEEKILSHSLLQTVRDVIGPLLIDLCIFDLYCGEKIKKNEKSLALGLTLQHPSRTLKDEEINGWIESALTALADQHGAKLRS
jgi:phenylalanyl-tRNA synthetase beta chain